MILLFALVSSGEFNVFKDFSWHPSLKFIERTLANLVFLLHRRGLIMTLKSRRTKHSNEPMDKHIMEEFLHKML